MGNTIHVREVTTSRMTLTAPSGTVSRRSEHDATIAVVAAGADSARGWYERLRIAMVTPQGRQAPATDGALSRPFELTFDARGRITTVRAPEGASFRAERIIRSRVVRDTLVAGESAWVIESVQRSTGPARSA